MARVGVAMSDTFGRDYTLVAWAIQTGVAL